MARGRVSTTAIRGKAKKRLSTTRYPEQPRTTAVGLRRWGTSDGTMADPKPWGTGTRRRGTKSRKITAEREVTYRTVGSQYSGRTSVKKTGRVGRTAWTLAK